MQWTYFGILFDPCAFDTLHLIPDKVPFKNSHTLLLDQERDIEINLEDFVRRTTI